MAKKYGWPQAPTPPNNSVLPSPVSIAKVVMYDDNDQPIAEKTWTPVHMQKGDTIRITWDLICQ